ncbi:MAG TPA: DNA glycosylase [Fimbriimonadaceae bacterium]
MEELDLPLCVTSGQVFRWREVEPACWAGVDGPNWYFVNISGPQLSIESNATENEFKRLFGLDQSMATLKKELLTRGPELKPHLDCLTGLRVMQPTSLHETLFCFMCTSNNHLKRITQMVLKLEQYGPVMAEYRVYPFKSFPGVERIAAIPEDELRAAGFGYRGKSIPLAAQQIVANGPGWFDSLKSLPFQEARAQLLTLHGIGPKLADCIALYGLHCCEATPFDTHLWQAYCRLYAPDLKEKPLTKRLYDEASEFMRQRFGPYAGLAHLYMYFENLKNWRTRLH